MNRLGDWVGSFRCPAYSSPAVDIYQNPTYADIQDIRKRQYGRKIYGKYWEWEQGNRVQREGLLPVGLRVFITDKEVYGFSDYFSDHDCFWRSEFWKELNNKVYATGGMALTEDGLWISIGYIIKNGRQIESERERIKFLRNNPYVAGFKGNKTLIAGSVRMLYSYMLDEDMKKVRRIR